MLLFFYLRSGKIHFHLLQEILFLIFFFWLEPYPLRLFYQAFFDFERSLSYGGLLPYISSTLFISQSLFILYSSLSINLCIFSKNHFISFLSSNTVSSSFFASIISRLNNLYPLLRSIRNGFNINFIFSCSALNPSFTNTFSILKK